jgi:hypothetical protein
MAESSSKSIDLLARIAIPLVAFIGGMLVQYTIASRTLTQQEFTTATAIATNEAAQKNQKLKEWADTVIAQYVAEKKQPPQPKRPIQTDQFADYILVSKSIADKICLFPKEGFIDPAPSIIDKIDTATQKAARNMDARLVAVEAVSDYRLLRSQYQTVQGILKDSCGFLLRR